MPWKKVANVLLDYYSTNPKIVNHNTKEGGGLTLCGGAVPREKVVNVLLAHKAKGSGVNTGRAAQGIARSAARELLGPLLDTACARLGFVLRRAFDIASERQHLLRGWRRCQTPLTQQSAGRGGLPVCLRS